VCLSSGMELALFNTSIVLRTMLALLFMCFYCGMEFFISDFVSILWPSCMLHSYSLINPPMYRCFRFCANGMSAFFWVILSSYPFIILTSYLQMYCVICIIFCLRFFLP
jgi:hypothetical protein